jgi:hypothetical protein
MKDRICFLPFFHSLQTRNQLTHYVKTSCFHFVKINNHNNKDDINLKTLQVRNSGKYEKNLLIFSASNSLPNNHLKYFTTALKHLVYDIHGVMQYITNTRTHSCDFTRFNKHLSNVASSLNMFVLFI